MKMTTTTVQFTTRTFREAHKVESKDRSGRHAAMVKTNRAQARTPGGIVGFTICGMFIFRILFAAPPTVDIVKPPSTEAESNAAQVKLWREVLLDKCRTAKSEGDMKELETQQSMGFLLPRQPKNRPRDDSAVKMCNNVFMDMGANIGDTSGHLMNSGMVSCDRLSDLKAGTNASHFSVVNYNFSVVHNRNMMVVDLEKLFEAQSKKVKSSKRLGPEDYCYYGIEGNPTFTKRLQEIEDFVMAIQPRPLEHMHFFTESVGAGEDGMTKLYLDTVNTKFNFWGSSILKEHNDVKQSAEGKDVETVATPVMGYTVGTLMRKTLQAFNPTASKAEKKGGHFILKMDIEGGEYVVLQEAARDRTLCEYIKMGNTVDLYVEWHGESFFGGGKKDFIETAKKSQKTLERCGVKFRTLGGWWV
jgi:Methyltransferase FkbM domain